ncbi:MAG TPA: glycosyl hydrolase family 28-related protein [Fimbriimonadaceae bacterium]|nr:glycosyl hydrolase family 28-related protein [Fimbriimonadaceae bacterium]
MRLVLPLLLLASLSSAQELNVREFGAKGDGKTDDAAAFQNAMAKAAEEKGLTVYAPPGNYVFKSNLNVPAGVCLRGSWQSVPAHNGLRDIGLPKPTDDGTTFLVETGEGTEAGAFLTLNTNGTLKGVVIYYPDQNRSGEPKPYPYAIAMRGKNPAVLDVELLNPYNGIDASQNERHLIRNVDGQPLRRGIYVDAIYDIGRIENVHFNPWWSMEPDLFKWQQEHGEAFIIGRSDWQYMTNTFCFGYNVGYHFVETKNGVCNGNFLGLGADDCFTAVQVEQCAPFGLLITNGEFVSFHGPDPTMVRVSSSNTGSIRFSNCAFWGPCNQIARIEGKGTAGFSDCTFVQWKKTAIEALGGTTLLRGCEFRENGNGVHAGTGANVVVSDCVGPGSTRIAADTGSHVKGPN